MITFNFYTMEERTPKHNEDIMILRKTSSFGISSFRPKETYCVYEWVDTNGETCGWSENDLPEDTKDMTLRITCDGYVMDENIVWCPVEECWAVTDTMFGEGENNV